MSKIYKELCSEKDIAAFDKGRYATRTGFGRRPAVLVVDMTQGFISEKSLMGTGTPGRDAAANIAKLLKRAREKLLPIFQAASRLLYHLFERLVYVHRSHKYIQSILSS